MRVFTTGQAAKYCEFSSRKIAQLFDSGKLKGYRMPGSKHRIIPEKYLIQFLKENGMPLGTLETDGMAKVLIVGQDTVLIDGLIRELRQDRDFYTVKSQSIFDAGITAESLRPNALVLDFSIGKAAASKICNALRSSSTLRDTILVAILPDEDIGGLNGCPVDELFKRPFDVVLLAERLRTLLSKAARLN